MMARVWIVVATVVGCTRAVEPQARPEPAAKPEPAGPAVVAAPEWEIHYRSQFFGTALGPLKEVVITSDGLVTVREDHRETGAMTVTATEMVALANLLTPDRMATLRAAASEATDAGPMTHLTITEHAAIALDATWGKVPAGAAPIVGEVIRLRSLVAPPENFTIEVGERTTAGVDGVFLSSNGYVEIRRDGAKLGSAFLLHGELDPLRALLADRDLRGLAATAASPTFTVKITGDIAADAGYAAAVPAPAKAVFDEVRRLGAAVTASLAPPAAYTVVYTKQEHGAGLGPLRTVTIRSDGTLVVEDEGRPKRTKQLDAAAIKLLANELAAPSFALAAPIPPSSEGYHYRIVVTGDLRRDVTYTVTLPLGAQNLLRYLDFLAS